MRRILERLLMWAFVQTVAAHTFSDITPSHLGNTGLAAHSITFADINGDGYPDLYVTMYRNVVRPDLLFINQGDGSFVEAAASRGADDRDGGSHGACFTDLDNDGDFDLFNGTTRNDYPGVDELENGQHNDVLINDGLGYFQDITSGINDIRRRKERTRTVLSLDIDNDGYLDLFGVTGYKGTADWYTDDGIVKDRNEIYRNLHNLDFESIEAGACYLAPMGQGAVDTDYDGDGDVDIIGANRSGELNILRNRGNGAFDLIDADAVLFPKVRVQAATAGVTYTCQAGDGISMGDVDNDGDLDMLLVTFAAEEAHLYLNRGNGLFDKAAQSWTGIEGYMGNFADLDHDGDLDLIFAGTRWVWLNDGSGYFPKDDMVSNGLEDIRLDSPRALAFADIDRDGDLDFGMADKYVRASLVRNDLDTTFHWLQVQLTAPNGQAGAFGSRVYAHTAAEDSTLICMREARSNTGYLAQNDPVLHFGLNVHDTVDLTVRFLDGTVLRRENVTSDQRVLMDGSAVEEPTDIWLACRAFIGGAYNDSLRRMRTDLQAQSLLPLDSPYTDHSITLGILPDNVTDWILCSLYADTTQSPVLSRSCLLKADGTLTDAETGLDSLQIRLPRGNYYIGLHHRNHVNVFSPPITLESANVEFDFTQMESACQCPVVVHSDTIYVIQGGNADGGEGVDASDLIRVKDQMLKGVHGYDTADVNLDGHVYASDIMQVKEALP